MVLIFDQFLKKNLKLQIQQTNILRAIIETRESKEPETTPSGKRPTAVVVEKVSGQKEAKVRNDIANSLILIRKSRASARPTTVPLLVIRILKNNFSDLKIDMSRQVVNNFVKAGQIQSFEHDKESLQSKLKIFKLHEVG